MAEKGTVYSYHTFLYPFLLDGSVEDFLGELNEENWKPDNMIDEDGKLTAPEPGGKADQEQQQRVRQQQLLDYQAFQYFNTATRRALFGMNQSVVHCYQLPAACDGKYTIQKDEETYELNINAIRLKVFNTGVAVIVFETEYLLPAGGVEQARKDIRVINEYGRRLYPEFLPSQESGLMLCAEEISIKLEQRKITENFRARAEAHLTGQGQSYLKRPEQLPQIITGLLAYPHTEKEPPQDFYTIKPAIDDRMFVCCCILDSEYTNHFIRSSNYELQCFGDLHKQEHIWKFMTDWETGCELYAVVNIDAGDASCQNRVMLDQYFKEQLYLRWIEYGTIHAVTNHSMVCLTSPAAMDFAVNPFLVLYVQMCILVLAQRASLISFDSKITGAIANAQGKAESIEGKCLDELIDLSQKFAIFQGQLLIPEVTPQIQGIELYEKLQNMLFIDKLEKNIQQQLNNLFEIAESNQEKSQQKMERAFTVLAILAVGSAWTDIYDFFCNPVPRKWQDLLWIIVIVSVSAWAVYVFRHVIFNWLTNIPKRVKLWRAERRKKRKDKEARCIR